MCCNLYAIMRARAETAKLARAMRDINNNQPPAPGVYPDCTAPVVVRGTDGQREMRDMRWGMPSSKKALLDAATKRADKGRCDEARVCTPSGLLLVGRRTLMPAGSVRLTMERRRLFRREIDQSPDCSTQPAHGSVGLGSNFTGIVPSGSRFDNGGGGLTSALEAHLRSACVRLTVSRLN